MPPTQRSASVQRPAVTRPATPAVKPGTAAAGPVSKQPPAQTSPVGLKLARVEVPKLRSGRGPKEREKTIYDTEVVPYILSLKNDPDVPEKECAVALPLNASLTDEEIERERNLYRTAARAVGFTGRSDVVTSADGKQLVMWLVPLITRGKRSETSVIAPTTE